MTASVIRKAFDALRFASITKPRIYQNKTLYQGWLNKSQLSFSTTATTPPPKITLEKNKISYQGLLDISQLSFSTTATTPPPKITLKKNFEQLRGASELDQIIQSGYYVDKTKYIQEIIEAQSRLFLIRPRRFGKSVMLDTFSKICDGKTNKKLFENTAIGQSTTYNWKKYPVFKFDFSSLSTESAEEFKIDITDSIKENCTKYEIQHRKSNNIRGLMQDMLKGGAELKNGFEPTVVVLIDEYDAPLSNCNHKIEIIAIMKQFFSNLKGGKTKTVFVTGVSRFGLSDVLSAANDLVDITLCDDYNAILGFTQAELIGVFSDQIDKMSTSLRMDREAFIKEVKRWYNGFNFSGKKNETLYNPCSIVQLFLNKKFKCYWDGKCLGNHRDLIFQDTGSITLLSKKPVYFADSIDLNFEKEYKEVTLKSLLFQTGYLTVKNFNHNTGIYTLIIPNHEVGMLLKKMMTGNTFFKSLSDGRKQLLKSIMKNDFEQFIYSFRCHYNARSYVNAMKESNVHDFFHGILRGLYETTNQITISSEKSSRSGRSDIEIVTLDCTKIIELKYFPGKNYNKTRAKLTARKAIDQIYNSRYCMNHEVSREKIFLIGLVWGQHDLLDSLHMSLEDYKKLREEEENKILSLFLTLIDQFKSNTKTINNLHQDLSTLLDTINDLSFFTDEFKGREPIRKLLKALKSMPASDKLTESQVQQLLLDLKTVLDLVLRELRIIDTKNIPLDTI